MQADETTQTVIGIDPGRKTGLAIWQRDGWTCHTTTFWGAIEHIQKHDPDTTLVVVEDPGKNPTTFSRRAGRRAMQKISRNVGRNQEQATQLIEGAERLGFEVVAVRPVSSKWNRRTCKAATGYDDSPNNEHVRDAIKMAWQHLPPSARRS